MLSALLFGGIGWAASLVLAPAALSETEAARLAVAAGAPSGEAQVARLGTVVADLPPIGFPGLALRACAGPPTDLATLRALVKSLEGKNNYLKYGEALGVAAQARATLGCLAEPLAGGEEGLPARLATLEAVAHAGLQDEPAARRAFRAALVVSPGLRWDSNLPSDWRPLFEGEAAAVGAAPRHTLTVVPQRALSQVWVDGRPVDVPVPLAAGIHWLQYLGPTGVVTLEAEVDGGGTLYLPQLLGDTAVEWVEDPARAPHLQAVLAASLGPDTPVWITLEQATWAGTPAAGFERVRGHVDPAVRRARTRGALLVSGGLGVAAGGAVALAGLLGARAAAAEAGAAVTWADWSAANARYEQGRAELAVGEILGGAGAAVFTVGLVLPLGGRTADAKEAP